jgi:hypothetical protein
MIMSGDLIIWHGIAVRNLKVCLKTLKNMVTYYLQGDLQSSYNSIVVLMGYN